MRSERQAQLDRRRGELVARSAALRVRLARDAQVLERPLALADRARAGIQWLAARPVWLAAIVALPALLRPRRALRWALKLWWGWGVWRRLRGLPVLQAPWNPPAR